jgi:hypothetical protein
MTTNAQAFFEAYRDAFRALDGAAVARCYAEPSGISQDGVYTHWANRAAVQANMDALCQLYRERGLAGVAFELRQVLPLGSHALFADVHWRIDWAGDDTGVKAPWHFGTAYHLMRTPEGWKVLLCTAYDEAALFQA